VRRIEKLVLRSATLAILHLSALSLHLSQSYNAQILMLLPGDCSAQKLGDESIWNGGLSVTPGEKWQFVRGAYGLWAMSENAGVMMEMANYAAHGSDAIDRELLATLRADAMQI
jgi:hypothetical protein